MKRTLVRDVAAGRRRPRGLPGPFRCLLAVVALVLLAGVAAWALRAPLLRAVGRHLSVEDPLPARADAIFVLEGGIDTRPFRAAALFARGVAPRILLARVEDTPAVRAGVYPNETDAAVRILRRRGVPAAAITVLPGPVSSTWEEAGALRAWLGSHGAHVVVVVTSRYHTRRARWALRRRLAGLDTRLAMVAVDVPGVSPDAWWTTEAGLLDYFAEYVKLAYYHAAHRGD